MVKVKVIITHEQYTYKQNVKLHGILENTYDLRGWVDQCDQLNVLIHRGTRYSTNVINPIR